MRAGKEILWEVDEHATLFIEPNAARAGAGRITVTAVNDAPVAKEDSYEVDEDNTLNIDAPGVLANDDDVDNTAAELKAVQVSGPAHGTLTLNDDGSFEYKPEANYNGTDTFTYKANDVQADSNTAMVSITVNAVNDAPVSDDQSLTTEPTAPRRVPARRAPHRYGRSPR
jgi:VCBS repeat-containing protein